MSRVGNDDDGRDLIAALRERGVDTDRVQTDDTHDTGRVEVLLKGDLPEYDILEDVAWDVLEASEDWLKLAAECNAICFGSLAQRGERSRTSIQAIVQATRQSCLRIFDVNLRQNFYSREVLETSLAASNVVKLNREELLLIAQMFGCAAESEAASLATLKQKFELIAACVTLGEAGSILIKGDEVSIQKASPIKAADTIGAGDAFTAAMVHGMLRDWNVDQVNLFANKIGAYVASQKGAMPHLPEDLTRGVQ